MKKNSSEPDITYKSQEIEHYEERSKDNMKEGNNLGNCTPNEFNPSFRDSIEKSVENKEKVAEKVEGVLYPNTDNNQGDCPSQSILLEETLDPEVIVRDLEAHHLSRLGIKNLTQKSRNILILAAFIHISRRRGIMVSDLIETGKSQDYAEKIIQDGRRCGLLVPSKKRIRKQKQYFLANYKYVIENKWGPDRREEIQPNDILLMLAREFASLQNEYHRIGLRTNMVYLDDYEAIKWPISSDKNKQKVVTFRIDTRRSCTFTLSPTGTLEMEITSTVDPFKLHSYHGLIDFFGCCGKIEYIFGIRSGCGFNSIPNVDEWCLTRFDCNKDLNMQRLSEKYPEIHWTAKGLLQLKHFGVLFQGYCKGMPDAGDCLRLEADCKLKEDSKASDAVSQLNKGNFPFPTADELLESTKK